MRVGSEIETKFELDEIGFKLLKSAGRVEKCIRQLNVYFDANWALANMAATFRVRLTPHAPPEATLKLPVTQTGTTRTMKEIEVLLREPESSTRSMPLPHRHLDVSRDLPFELRAEILRLGVKSLERVGWMRNTRYLVSIEAGGHIELDCTILPDGSTVFEAEIESPDTTTHRRLSQLILNTVPWARPSRMSKFQRFRKAADAVKSRASLLSYASTQYRESREAASLSSDQFFSRKVKRLLRLLLGRSDGD